MASPLGIIAEYELKIIDRSEHIVGVVKDELGILAHALYESLQYDCKRAFDRGVAIGTYTVNTFEAIGKQELYDYWQTVKDQIVAKLPEFLAMIKTNGMPTAIQYATSLLANVNWRGVGVALDGIATSTLRLTANMVLQMVVTGVLVAA